MSPTLPLLKAMTSIPTPLCLHTWTALSLSQEGLQARAAPCTAKSILSLALVLCEAIESWAVLI